MTPPRIRRVFGPKRSLRHELLSIAPILALPVAILAVFPRDAVGFADAPAEREPGAPSCAIVELSPEAEARSVALVRSALSVNARSVRNLRADLSLSTVDEEVPEPVMDISDRARATFRPSRVRYDMLPMPPTVAAPEPAVLPPEPDEDKPAFSREELLKLD